MLDKLKRNSKDVCKSLTRTWEMGQCFSRKEKKEIISTRCLEAVKETMEVIKDNLEVDGLFTTSGNLRTRKKIQSYLSRGDVYTLRNWGFEFVVECAAALKIFLQNLPQPLIPVRIQQLVVAENNGVPEKTIANDALGLLKEEVNGRHKELLLEVFTFLKEAAVKVNTSELTGCNLPLKLLPVFFEIEYDKEMVDCRGRTPLMLAVTLGHLESVKVLVQHLTNVNAENKEGWTVVQEAVATGDPEMVQLLLERRDVQRQSDRMGGIPQLLDKLREAPDFYVEMKWEFSSWVPLVSRMCPSDTYKVYKQGSSVRVDTTLLGFDQSSWQRGNRSYIFVGESDSAVMMEIDHETEEVFMEQMKILPPENFLSLQRSVKAVSSRLTSPIVTTYIDTDKINFERNKAGLWGWRSDKTEHVNGHNCKVFSATNVELVTKTRLEHLTDSDKEKAKSPKTPLQSFLGIAETEHRQSTSDADSNDETLHSTNPCKITPEEYFDPSTNLEGRDIGRPKEVVVKVQKFKANLWLCEDYPLSLQEQIMPIVDLMAISSSHFAKLKDFIQMQLPSGFPIKIEIPLFHILHARITFGNIFGLDEAVPGVQRINDNGKVNCIVSDSCFEPPPGYAMIGPENRRQYSLEEEDDLIQFAIQQSLLELGSEKDEVDIWEALRAQKPSRPTTPNLNSEEARQLQRAIQASLEVNLNEPTFRSSPDGSEEYAVVDEELSRALALSQRHHEEEERRQKEEEDIVRRVLELSLTEQ